MSIVGTVYEDVTTDVLGVIGPWQWFVTICSTVLMVPAIFNQDEDIFLLKQSNEILCVPPANIVVRNLTLCGFTEKNNVKSENNTLKCNKWRMKIMGLFWIEKSELIFCDDKSLLLMATTSRFGSVLGCVIFGILADSFGRKLTIIINVFAELVFRLVITFYDSGGWSKGFVFCRSLLGSASAYMGLLIICEIASNHWRSWLNVIASSPRIMAMTCMVPLVNSTSNLETYNFIACLYSIFLIGLLRWIPESPPWLLYHKNISKAEKILTNAAKINSVKLSDDFKIWPASHRAYQYVDDTRMWLGLNTHNIRVIIITCLLFWCLYYFLWSCLYVKLYNEGHIYNLLWKVCCFLGILACLANYSAKFFKMRYLLLFSTLTTGAGTICVIYYGQKSTTLISSAALASGIVGHALILNITPRLFALRIRATLFGCCYAAGQLGTIINYLMVLLQAMNNLSLIILEIGVTLSLAVLCMIFPDVDGRELPDVNEDMDYFSELTKPLRWATQKTDNPSQEEVEVRVHSYSSDRVSGSQSEERLRAKPIGLSTLWRTIAYRFRRKAPNVN